MKIRKNFVSNSSSSSFIVIGELLAIGYDILDLDLSPYDKVIATGIALSNAYDVFYFKKEYQDFLRNEYEEYKKNPYFRDSDFKITGLTLYHGLLIPNDRDFSICSTILRGELKDNIRYCVFEIDQDPMPSENIDMFIGNYQWDYK